MPWTIVRNLSPETYRALRARAKRNGRSTDSELRAILDEALLPVARVTLDHALAAFQRPLSPFELKDLAAGDGPADSDS